MDSSREVATLLVLKVNVETLVRIDFLVNQDGPLLFIRRCQVVAGWYQVLAATRLLGVVLTLLITVGPYLGVVDDKLGRLGLTRHLLQLPVWIQQIDGVFRLLVVIRMFRETDLFPCMFFGNILDYYFVAADSLRTPRHPLRAELPLFTLLIQLRFDEVFYLNFGVIARNRLYRHHGQVGSIASVDLVRQVLVVCHLLSRSVGSGATDLGLTVRAHVQPLLYGDGASCAERTAQLAARITLQGHGVARRVQRLLPN